MSSQFCNRIAIHYARLGLQPGATRTEIAAAYRAAALRSHPDRGGDAVAFAAVRDSYDAILRSMVQHQPASLRSFSQGKGDWDGIWGILGAVVLPSAVGMGVGIRLMVSGGEREGLRAGGTSRIYIMSDSQRIDDTSLRNIDESPDRTTLGNNTSSNI